MDIQEFEDKKIAELENACSSVGSFPHPDIKVVSFISAKNLLHSSLHALLTEIEKAAKIEWDRCIDNGKVFDLGNVLTLLRPSEPKEWCCTWKSCEKCNNK